jgi:hypothetical protein
LQKRKLCCRNSAKLLNKLFGADSRDSATTNFLPHTRT